MLRREIAMSGRSVLQGNDHVSWVAKEHPAKVPADGDEAPEDEAAGALKEGGSFQSVFPVGYGVGASKVVGAQAGFRRSNARPGLERY